MKRFLPAFLLLALLMGCNKIRFGDMCPTDVSFLTGECLKDGTLLPEDPATTHRQYEIRRRINPETGKSETGIYIRLYLNLEKEYSLFSYQLGAWMPSDNVYASFGENANQVKKDYVTLYDSFSKYGNSETVTIYSGDDIVISSNAKVCGVAPGNNLYPTLATFSTSFTSSAPGYQLPEDTIPAGNAPIGMSVSVYISSEEGEIVDGTPTFYISIPVKVGMYLTYLNEKRTNPEAKIQYRDEVLTGAVSIDKNIQ